MAEGNDEKRGSTPLERWFDHAVRVITVAAILGGGTLLMTMSADIKVLQTKLELMTAQITAIQAGTANRYTSSDAGRDLAIIHAELRDHEDRIRDLERPTR